MLKMPHLGTCALAGLLSLASSQLMANTPATSKPALPAKTEQLAPSINPLTPADHSTSVTNKSRVATSIKAPTTRKAVSSKSGKKPLASVHAHKEDAGPVQALVKAMVAANQRYMSGKPAAYFERFANKQTPRATVVTCSDSRVQSNAFHADAVNDLFMVRNIGNQLATSEGSIEYGIRHLHTPLLLFIGHAVCGAVQAASGDYSSLEAPIRKELLTINIPKGINVNDGVLLNINNQVDSALLKFGGEVDGGRLAVIGAFYDFRNDYKQGRGKLIITNINGETDPARLAALTRAGNFFLVGNGIAGATASH